MKTTETIKPTDPLEILHEFASNPLIDSFLNRGEKKALDIGCKVPWHIWNLYYENFGFKEFYGFEYESEPKILRDYLAQNFQEFAKPIVERERDKIKTIFDLHRLLFVPLSRVGAFKIVPSLIEQQAYESVFKIKYGGMWDSYDTHMLLFDYVILSNVIHLQKDGGKEESQKISSASIEFMVEAKNALRPGGLIYIRIPYKGYSPEPTARHIRFDETSLRKFIGGGFTEIDFRIEPGEKGTPKKASMVFLGAKK